VLLDIDEYRRITGSGKSILDLLWDPEAAKVELEIPPRQKYEPRPMEFD
jgi:hypothetical protein